MIGQKDRWVEYVQLVEAAPGCEDWLPRSPSLQTMTILAAPSWGKRDSHRVSVHKACIDRQVKDHPSQNQSLC